MAAPAIYPLALYQGDDFEVTFRLREQNPDGTLGAYLNLTDATGKAQIRPIIGDPTVLAEFVCTVLEQVATPGGVTISLDHTTTAGLTPTGTSSYVWDFQITDSNGKVTTYLKGAVTLDGEVTHV